MARKLGPECPRCECPDTEVVGERLVFGQKRERCECAFCGYVFTAGGIGEQEPGAAARDESAELEVGVVEDTAEKGGIAYNSAPPRCVCPKCSARNPLVKKTDPAREGRVVRYHRCEACGFRFKSIEEAGARQK